MGLSIILLLSSKVHLGFVDYITLVMVVTRGITCIFMFKSINAGAAGFEDVDLKQMSDTITFIGLPGLILFSINWKVELFVTSPVIIVSSYMTIYAAFSTEGENMACYKQGELTAST